MGLLDRFGRKRPGYTRPRALDRALSNPTPRNLDRLLAEVIDDHDNSRQLGCTLQLAEGSPAAVALLGRVVMDERWGSLARHEALLSLARQRHAALLPAIDPLSSHRDPFERAGIAQAIAEYGAPELASHLVPLLQDEAECASMWAYWRVMDDAARAVRRLGDPAELIPQWAACRIAELTGESRRWAAVSLGFIEHPAAIEALTVMREEGDDWAGDLLAKYPDSDTARP